MKIKKLKLIKILLIALMLVIAINTTVNAYSSSDEYRSDGTKPITRVALTIGAGSGGPTSGGSSSGGSSTGGTTTGGGSGGGASGSGASGGGIFSGADEFISKGSELAGTRGETDAAKAVNEVGAMMVNIAGYILVIGVIVVGIKYMMANPEGKAKLKGQLIGLLIATVVIYGAKFIWSTIVGLF